MKFWSSAGVALAASLLAAQPAEAATGKSVPSARWLVQRVFTDPRLNNSQRTIYNDDPRLLGRHITIERGRAEIDDGSGPCPALGRRVVRISASKLLEHQLRGKPGNTSLRLIAQKLGLQTGLVPITTYSCLQPASKSAGMVWSGLSSFPLSGGRLGLIYGGEAVLVLTIDRGGNIVASACDNGNPSERTICADRGLTAWARSVALALAIRRDGNNDFVAADDTAALQQNQAQWQIERDRCGTDRTCLRDRMIERTSVLMQQEPIG
jgi:hypothetical protein